MAEEEIDDMIDVVENKQSIEKGGKGKIREYWFEIVLAIIGLFFMYYWFSNFITGGWIFQLLIFALPFIGLWIFYKVNMGKTAIRKKDSQYTKKWAAIQQGWTCAQCQKTLPPVYEIVKVADTKMTDDLASCYKAVCPTCYGNYTFNKSLYTTIKDLRK
jgi:hypothetical protein